MCRYCLVILMALGLAGCTTYHGLKPINPSRFDESIITRPMFQWQQSDKKTVTYDFIIYELVMKRTSGLNYVPTAGERIYYRENIEKPEHTLETDLKPGREYLWSVRVREGSRVGPWSVYDFNAYYVFGYVMQKNYFFQLKIVDPKASKDTAPKDLVK